MTVHCTSEEQTNLLLKNGWKLNDVRNSAPANRGFVYILIKF